MSNNYTDVENWGIFLKQITVKNILGEDYQCNNDIILIPITKILRALYKSNDKAGLADYLTALLNDHNIDLKNDDYFVKISSTSGKDILYESDSSVDDDIPVDEFWTNMNIATRKLIIKNVDDLCDYLLKSERISFSIKTSKNLVFRKWIDYRVEEEFRCFIYKNKLVAISQYDYGNELPIKMRCTATIVNVIKNFVNQVKLPFNSVVMDVAFHISNHNVYFIEFNEFGLTSNTDAGIYDWVHDADILYSEGSYTDIRLFDMDIIRRKFSI